MILKELLTLLEARPVKGDWVKVNPEDWKSLLRKKSDGYGKVIDHDGTTGIVVQLDDSKETVIAYEGEYRRVNSGPNDHEAWQEKRKDALSGRKYHE